MCAGQCPMSAPVFLNKEVERKRLGHESQPISGICVEGRALMVFASMWSGT